MDVYIGDLIFVCLEVVVIFLVNIRKMIVVYYWNWSIIFIIISDYYCF